MKRKHSEASSSLNDVLTSLSEVMKRVDKARDVVKKFGTILSQIKQIIHNDNSTLNSIENDVATWWLHVESQGKLRVAAIQKVRSATDESSIESAASELTSVMNSTNNVEKSMRRWARLVQVDNYSRESLRQSVMEWMKRWVDKWRTVEEAYRHLRKELLAACDSYSKLYKTRSSRNAVIDNAEDALNNASDLIAERSPTSSHQQMEAPSPPMAVPQHMPPPTPQKPTKRQRPKKKVAPAPTAPPQPQMPPGMTPEQFMQFMAYQQQQQQQQQHAQPPPPPEKPSPQHQGQMIYKSHGVNVITGNKIQDYSASQWS